MYSLLTERIPERLNQVSCFLFFNWPLNLVYLSVQSSRKKSGKLTLMTETVQYKHNKEELLTSYWHVWLLLLLLLEMN